MRTKNELAQKLTDLAPGEYLDDSSFTVARIFGNGTLDDNIIAEIKKFARQYKCHFFYATYSSDAPHFVKEFEDGTLPG
jgi:hypothetical protein